MLDNVKAYFGNVVIRKVGPQVAGTLIASLIGWMGTHEELLQQMGITYYANFTGVWDGPMPTGQLVTIELDTLHVWGGLAIVTGLMFLWGLFQHHASAAIKGNPQNGEPV